MGKRELLLNAQGLDAEELSWPFWFVAPLYPYGKRRTLRHEIVKDTIWTFDQIQGILYVVVPIRMTVVKLEAGGLLVYAPIAPTPECIRLVKELEAEHGEVKYIILPTVSGIEHKVFVGPFARRFPQALVFVAPNQWSFPINLPLSWLGLPMKRTQILPQDSTQTPFGNEFAYEILGPIDLRLGKFEEVALFHKRSRTLFLTDTVISVPETPPEIIQLDPYPLLFHARNSAKEPIVDNSWNRLQGWQRIVLFSLYFRPSVLETPKWRETFRQAISSPERSQKAFWGLYPFQWCFNWKTSFDAVRGQGRPFVAPILQIAILNREPQKTLAWCDRVASWDFTQIVPCHFQSPISATPQQFRQAFSFLEKQSVADSLPEADLELIRQIATNLNKTGIIPPAKEKV
ncbi:hypothetical protein C7B64_04510 [Merismopedia glauca CCAP 1448/3]|uniref:DUF4336 domain-containing protein n=1 Tax=Merismopedia glauca CCAP 1448/3 TaxID=1296344 RepID=A0A2T1C878_9CYAN|nr:hypothetical protein C7B64_04510 [Merismopedia glauca CCAP 1448/3]